VLIIKNLIFRLSLDSKIIKFFWVPSHVGITGNERADHLAFSTKFSNQFSNSKIPASDLLLIHRKLLRNAWQFKWSSLPLNFASWYRHTSPVISQLPWFNNLGIQRHLIVSFTHLRIEHSLLPHHSFKLSLNSSPLCTRHHEDTICDFSHIIFNCLFLIISRQLLFSFLSSL